MKHSFTVRAVSALLIGATLLLSAAGCAKKGKGDGTQAPQDQTATTRHEEVLIPISGDCSLVKEGDLRLAAPTLYLDSAAAPQLTRAVGDLAADFERVTTKKPEIQTDAPSYANAAVIIGTIGRSAAIDGLIEAGVLDVSEIRDKWEGYTIAVYKNLTDTAEYSVVIAGSDVRGTVYGVYTLSEKIGVSPWYWWADVPVIESKDLTLSVADLSGSEAPDVKYRGIFINDEANFSNWSARFVSRKDNKGAPGPEVYGHVFELLLRLKANTLHPGMHATTDAFNKYKDPKTGIAYNATLANEYGIIMGTSHCEMLLCNNETEWVPWCEANKGKYHLRQINGNWRSSYDYTVNAEAMNAYWEDRVAANYRFENIYTIGLRGVHDEGINYSAIPGASIAKQAEVVKQAVEAQLAILKKYEQKLTEETGVEQHFATVFCPYKEAADYYKYDISLPKDCMIMYADDNFGYVRQLPNASELETYGGFGVYYHVSYYGRPRSYLWIESTPLPQIYEEMDKAYNAGSDDLWILNVGDIKPAELSIDFFMNLAWSEDSFNTDNLDDYMTDFYRTTFALSEADAKSLSAAMTLYYQTATAFKPEFLGYNEGEPYSPVNFGDEAEIMITKARQAEAEAERIYNALPENYKDSFYQVVYYKTRCLRLMLEKTVYAAKNQLALSQGRFASVNAYAALAEAAYDQIMADIKTYNALSDGKWRNILNPYTSINALPKISDKPSVTYIAADLAEDGVRAAAEGQTGQRPNTLYFTSFTTSKRFIDIFSLGTKGYDFTVTADEALTLYDQTGAPLTGTASGGKITYAGAVGVETRIWVGVNREKLSGTYSGQIVVADRFGHTTVIPVEISALVNPAEQTQYKGYFEENGVISIEAEHFTENVAVGDNQWKVMTGLGVSGDSMKVFPDSSASASRINGDYENKAAYLSYRIYVTTPGSYNGTLFRIPTLNEGTTNGRVAKSCKIAYSVDGGKISTLSGVTTATNSDSGDWADGVRYNIDKLTFDAEFESAGWHEIRIYQADAGIAFDKIELIHESRTDLTSRTGAPESYQTVTDPKAQILPCPPKLSFDGIKYDESVADGFYFDMTSDPTKAASGYIGIDPSTQSSRAKRYEWLSGFESLKAGRRTVDKVSARDLGFLYSDQSAELRLTLSGPGKYVVTVAVGDRQSGGIATEKMSILANGKAVYSGINVAAGGICEYGFVVESTDGTITLKFEGNWTVAAIEIAPYTQVEVGGTTAFAPDENGDVMIEAESALQNTDFAWNTESTDGKGYRWFQTGGKYGTAMFFGPNTNSSYTVTDPKTGKTAQMNYKVDLKSGTYNLFALIRCQNADDDSVNVLMDGANAQTANDFENTNGFVWKKIGTFKIAEDGTHTLTLMGREDGFTVDRLVLTTQSSWK